MNNEEKILKTILKHPDGIALATISEKTKISRGTVNKYVHILEAKKKITLKTYGKKTLVATGVTPCD